MERRRTTKMSKHGCTTCGKEFASNATLKRHLEKKIPCKAPTQLLQATVQKALEEAGVSYKEEPLKEFREVSEKFHTSMSKEIRLEQGIFFTPKKARDLLFQKLSSFGITPKVILEPSFGSGEFLLDAKRLYPDAKLLGVEKNEELFKSVSLPGAELTCCDFLDWKGKSDLILGNPPYFVLESKSCKKGFDEAMTGRPNIYVMFLYKCLTEHLEDNGILAFILPTSLYNSSYYQPMRNYIQKNTTILYVETLNKPGFYETGQETMLLILQKKKENDNYIFRMNGKVYISPFYKELNDLVKDSTNLQALNLHVKTGNVVWNQVKGNLSEEGTLLLYSRNIQSGEIKLNNLLGKEKKQCVKGIEKPTISGPVILVERGYGNSFRLNSAYTELKNFYAENHVNVILPVKEDAIENLKRVQKSFEDERTKEFIRLFVGNGAMSATELETILPIY
jgi:adenine-specific DNA-methyltransferase